MNNFVPGSTWLKYRDEKPSPSSVQNHLHCEPSKLFASGIPPMNINLTLDMDAIILIFLTYLLFSFVNKKTVP